MARISDRDEEPRSWRDRSEDEAAAEEAARDLRLSLVGIRQRIWSLWTRADEDPDGYAPDDERGRELERQDDLTD